MEKKLRWLSVTDNFDDIAGKDVYSKDGLRMGRIVGEGDVYWLLDGGGKIHKVGSSLYYIEA